MFIKAEELRSLCEKANQEKKAADNQKLVKSVQDKLNSITPEEARSKRVLIDVSEFDSDCILLVGEELKKAGYHVHLDNYGLTRFSGDKQKAAKVLVVSWAEKKHNHSLSDLDWSLINSNIRPFYFAW